MMEDGKLICGKLICDKLMCGILIFGVGVGSVLSSIYHEFDDDPKSRSEKAVAECESKLRPGQRCIAIVTAIPDKHIIMEKK